MRRRRASTTVVFVALSLILTGCTTEQTPSHLELPAKNIEQWVMPLDQFLPQNRYLRDYAENLLVQPCMQEAGYDWSVPWRDLEARSPTENSVGIRIFTENIAKTWGYHWAGVPLSNADQWADFYSKAGNVSEAEFDTLRDCQTAARKTVPVDDDAANYVASLINAAEEASLQDSTVRTAASKWRECMLPQGVADLPDVPDDMPSPSLASRFRTDQPSQRPGPEERSLALFDFACRVSSGYREARYNAEWDEQVALLKKYGDEIARMGARLAEIDRKARVVIAQNAPEH